MIVRPSRRTEPKLRPALLEEPGRVRALDSGRSHDLDRLPQGLRCYALWDDVDRYARAGQGELLAWGDEPIRYRHRPHGDSHRRRSDVVILKQPCESRDELAHGIVDWCDWLARHRVEPGWSLGGASMGLLRATIDESLVTTNGQLPPPRWTLGGRQDCFVPPATTIRGAIHLDLPAAYTNVIGRLRYGGVWRRIDDGLETARLGRLADAGYPLLVRARVRLPDDLRVGPLHRRPRRRPDGRIEELAPTVPYPTEGILQGLWTWWELSQTLDTGARARLLEAYVHAGCDRPFGRWHEAIMEGRSLPGFAGLLCKATGNALWGQFVIDDRKRLCVQRWRADGKGYLSHPVQGSRGHQLRAWDIGELVCGEVRARLYHGLSQAPGDLVCCHTDGFWLRDTPRSEQARRVLEADGWRVKADASRLEIVDQQKYRYLPRGARRWRIVCSGVPSHRAAETFETIWQRFKEGT